LAIKTKRKSLAKQASKSLEVLKTQDLGLTLRKINAGTHLYHLTYGISQHCLTTNSFAKKDWVGDDGKERFSIELTLSNDPKGWDSKLAQYMCDYNPDWERS
jgi:hypothetical protein